MSTTTATTKARPWYREYWVWLLMIPPAGSVLGGVTMLYLATSQPLSLVVEDYARIEQITSERFARDQRASALGVEAALAFEPAGNGLVRVEAVLESAANGPAPASLELRMRHATREVADRVLTLQREDTRYRAFGDLADGRYRVELLDNDGGWRLAGALTHVAGTLRLRPNAPGE